MDKEEGSDYMKGYRDAFALKGDRIINLEQQIKQLEDALTEITEVPPIIQGGHQMFLIAKQALKALEE